MSEQALDFYDSVVARLRTELGDEWEENPGNCYVCFQFRFPDDVGKTFRIECTAEKQRFYDEKTGRVQLEIGNFSPVYGSTLPRKEYILTPLNVDKEWVKMQALLAKRLAVIKEDIEQTRAIVARNRDYETRLQAALDAAALPEQYWFKPYKWSDPELRNAKPVLRDDALRLKMEGQFLLSAEQAAAVFALIGGRLEVNLDRVLLTPEQYVRFQEIVSEGEHRAAE